MHKKGDYLSASNSNCLYGSNNYIKIKNINIYVCSLKK